MTLPIYLYGQPVLREVAQDITPEYPNLSELIDNMFETMEESDGVGLAAPQIGLPIRLLVVGLERLQSCFYQCSYCRSRRRKPRELRRRLSFNPWHS